MWVRYNTLQIHGIEVFYRDAGAKDAPVLLLLHSFPKSFNMFRNLIPRLAKFFRVIAPDYPGYGFSGALDHNDFNYTFENQTTIFEKLTQQLKLDSYALYVMDCGAPIGYCLTLRHPENITGIVVQNGYTYEEGLLKFWDRIKKYWNEPTQEKRMALAFMVSPDTTKWQYHNGVADPTLLDPTRWTLDQVLLDRNGNGDIQLDMLFDCGPNVPLHPERSFASTSRLCSSSGARTTSSFPLRARSPISVIFRRWNSPARYGAFRSRDSRRRDRRPHRGVLHKSRLVKGGGSDFQVRAAIPTSDFPGGIWGSGDRPLIAAGRELRS